VRGVRRILEELAELRRESAVQHDQTQTLIEQTQTLIEDLHQRYEDDRRVNREILRRSEIVMWQVVDAVAEFKEESRQTRAFSRRAAEATEAHTRAIFALIDRLGNGPAPASGAA
jgi:hypothetical protein